MAVFEIQGPDGKTYEVEAPDMQSAVSALQSLSGGAGGVSTNSEAVSDFEGKMHSATMGVVQGGLMGFEDNLAGVRGVIGGQMPDGEGGIKTDYSVPMGDRYRAMRDDARSIMSDAETSNPSVFNTGKVGGAGVTALASGPFATGKSVLGTMLRGGGIGGVEGALHEVGNADGEDVANAAARGTAWGAGLGFGSPALVAGGAATRRWATDPVTGFSDAVLGRANQTKASRALLRTMQASKKTPEELGDAVLRATREGQPEYRLMDAMGIPGQRAASGVARSGGDSGAEIAEFLEKRQLGQGERVGSFIDDGFGMNGQGSGNTLPVGQNSPATPAQILSGPQRSAASTVSALKNARGEAANVAYDAARGNAAPVDVTGALAAIDGRIGGMEGSGIAGDGIDAKLSRYRKRLAGDGAGLGDDVTGAELSDFDRVLGVKQAVQDDIGAAVRAGRANEARELGKLVKELDAALEGSSDMYRAANDGFREASGVIDAVQDGAHMANKGRPVDTVPRFQSMTPDQQAAARIGYGDSLLEKLERVTSPTSNRAKPLQSPKREAEAGAMTLDPELLGRRLSRENDMWSTQNRAVGGSRTADNEADKEAMTELAGGAVQAGRNLLNMRFGDAAGNIGAALGPVARGQTDQTRMLIAQALMSKDPQAALEPVLREAISQGKAGKVNRSIEAVLRNMLREQILQ